MGEPAPTPQVPVPDTVPIPEKKPKDEEKKYDNKQQTTLKKYLKYKMKYLKLRESMNKL